MIWTTPQLMFDRINVHFRPKVDLCADSDNAKLAKFHLREKALSIPWNEDGFLNPPFGRGIEDWVAKAREDANEYGVTHVCVIPSRTNPPWWHDSILKATEIWYVRKKGVPPWGVAIAIFYHGMEPGIGGPLSFSWDYKSEPYPIGTLTAKREPSPPSAKSQKGEE